MSEEQNVVIEIATGKDPDTGEVTTKRTVDDSPKDRKRKPQGMGFDQTLVSSTDTQKSVEAAANEAELYGGRRRKNAKGEYSETEEEYFDRRKAERSRIGGVPLEESSLSGRRSTPDVPLHYARVKPDSGKDNGTVTIDTSRPDIESIPQAIKDYQEELKALSFPPDQGIIEQIAEANGVDPNNIEGYKTAEQEQAEMDQMKADARAGRQAEAAESQPQVLDTQVPSTSEFQRMIGAMTAQDATVGQKLADAGKMQMYPAVLQELGQSANGALLLLTMVENPEIPEALMKAGPEKALQDTRDYLASMRVNPPRVAEQPHEQTQYFDASGEPMAYNPDGIYDKNNRLTGFKGKPKPTFSRVGGNATHSRSIYDKNLSYQDWKAMREPQVKAYKRRGY